MLLKTTVKTAISVSVLFGLLSISACAQDVAVEKGRSQSAMASTKSVVSKVGSSKDVAESLPKGAPEAGAELTESMSDSAISEDYLNQELMKIEKSSKILKQRMETMDQDSDEYARSETLLNELSVSGENLRSQMKEKSKESPEK